MSAQSTEIWDQLDEKEFVLTLDDGPHMWRTQKVLDVLDQHCVKATFFLQGKNAERHPRLASEIAARGHTIASHTFSHPRLPTMDLQDAVDDMTRGRDAVAAAFKDDSDPPPVSMFRFPFLATTPELIDAAKSGGMIVVPVQAGGADWTHNSPEESTALIMRKLSQHGDRGIVLLHDPAQNTDQRIDHLLRTLREQDYSIVHLVDSSEG